MRDLLTKYGKRIQEIVELGASEEPVWKKELCGSLAEKPQNIVWQRTG